MGAVLFRNRMDPSLQAISYTTTFPLTENPISEGGSWHHLDPLLTNVRTEVLGGVHVAHGTQADGPLSPYDDSNAYLTGFGPNQSIQATIWKSGTPAGTGPEHEVELLLHWSDDGPLRSTLYGDTHADGYEVNIHHNGDYLQLGRFKGALLTGVDPPNPLTGDIFKATATNNVDGSVTIVVTLNAVELINYTDAASPVRTGNPGIGFYRSFGGTNTVFGFSGVTALDLS